VWERSSCVVSLKSRLAFVLLSKLYRQMYAGTGISTDSARRKKSKKMARWIAGQTRKLFQAKPMPELVGPEWDLGYARKGPMLVPAVVPDGSAFNVLPR